VASRVEKFSWRFEKGGGASRRKVSAPGKGTKSERISGKGRTSGKDLQGLASG